MTTPFEIKDLDLEQSLAVQRAVENVRARRSFWLYCQRTQPDFYTDEHTHLKHLCTILESFFYRLPLDSTGRIYDGLMINMPPQHGKTRTLVNFCAWALGKIPEHRIITGSYNDDTAQDFSRYARDTIQMQKFDPETTVFSDIFPKVKIKRGSASVTKWALEGQHFNYLGAGMGGSVTSKGATIRIIDDLVKGAKEALNQNYLNDCWRFWSSTMASRRSGVQPAGGLIDILCMTRWALGDICGKELELNPAKWYVLKMPAYDPKTDKMLCDNFLTKKEYLDIKKTMLPEIFFANYDQEPVDVQGKLYTTLRTYKTFPVDKIGRILFEQIKCYCDTADQGADYLCNLIYGIYDGKAWVLDVYYTKDGMEITEPETAKRLHQWKVNHCVIESNSGGRGFARNVKRHLKEDQKNKKCVVMWFHQAENKRARIIANSASVMQRIFFPVDWQTRWPLFYEHVTKFTKEGTGQFDDAPDTLTGAVERLVVNAVEVFK